MNRFVYYEKKIAYKLLLSKFVYPTTKDQIRLLKMTTAVLPPEKDSEVAAFGLAVVYGRFPTFTSSFHHTEKSKVLRRISLTATSKKALTDLQLLVNKIIPFQFENKKYYPRISTNGEINWLMVGCTPPNDVNYIFFKYPLSQNQFDVALQLQFSKQS